jgi:serine-type D-Ala-D-Ala carboxypeptidase (penicillin-binding protein 5/6)
MAERGKIVNRANRNSCSNADSTIKLPVVYCSSYKWTGGMKPGRYFRLGIRIFLAAGLSAALTGCAPSQQSAPPYYIPPPRPVHTYENAPARFTFDAHSAYVIERRTGTILYKSRENDRMQPGSSAKLMTFYITLKALREHRISLDTKVVVGKEAADVANDPTLSRMMLKLGDQVTVQQLLYGMMVHSGCDAAVALADLLGGNSDHFVVMMNNEAERIGMVDSHFAMPNGLPMPGEYVTAEDMALLGRTVANEYPEAMKYTSRTWYSFNGKNQQNTNPLLFMDARVNGLKTGHVDEAGFHLIASATTPDLEVVSAVMGSPTMRDRAVNSENVLNWVFDTYATIAPDWRASVPNSIAVRNGAAPTVAIALARAPLVVIRRDEKPMLSVHANIEPGLAAPVSKGQTVGSLVISGAGRDQEIAIVTTEAVPMAAATVASAGRVSGGSP